MSSALLGQHFDIHGGGQDLQFPHHENEIAQSEGAHRHEFVNYWMHNGFVRVDNEKMSKSLGNFFTVREILSRYDPEVVRFFIVRAHYRSPLNYSDHHLDDAKQALTRLYTALKDHDIAAGDVAWDNAYASRFRDAMNDDFNTPEAVAVLFELAGEVNRTGALVDATLCISLAAILGLLQRDPTEFLQALPSRVTHSTSGVLTGQGSTLVGTAVHTENLVPNETIIAQDGSSIEHLITLRLAARKAKNFAEADRIRKGLLDAGIVLEDKPDGTTEWRRS
jgi:cysteinyl-tRNA synthetase